MAAVVGGADHSFKGAVELFPQKGGWHFVRVPETITADFEHFADRGVIAVRAQVGQTSWDTSLLPMGDGTHFIALGKSVREKEELDVGDKIAVSITPRTR